MDAMEQQKFFDNYKLFMQEVVQSGITDVHISSGDFVYVRKPSRDVEPASQF